MVVEGPMPIRPSTRRKSSSIAVRRYLAAIHSESANESSYHGPPATTTIAANRRRPRPRPKPEQQYLVERGSSRPGPTKSSNDSKRFSSLSGRKGPLIVKRTKDALGIAVSVTSSREDTTTVTAMTSPMTLATGSLESKSISKKSLSPAEATRDGFIGTKKHYFDNDSQKKKNKGSRSRLRTVLTATAVNREDRNDDESSSLSRAVTTEDSSPPPSLPPRGTVTPHQQPYNEAELSPSPNLPSFSKSITSSYQNHYDRHLDENNSVNDSRKISGSEGTWSDVSTECGRSSVTEVVTNRAIDMARKRIEEIESRGGQQVRRLRQPFDQSQNTQHQVLLNSLRTSYHIADAASNEKMENNKAKHPARYRFGPSYLNPRPMEAHSILSESSCDESSIRSSIAESSLAGRAGPGLLQLPAPGGRVHNLYSHFSDDTSSMQSQNNQSLDSMGVEIGTTQIRDNANSTIKDNNVDSTQRVPQRPRSVHHLISMFSKNEETESMMKLSSNKFQTKTFTMRPRPSLGPSSAAFKSVKTMPVTTTSGSLSPPMTRNFKLPAAEVRPESLDPIFCSQQDLTDSPHSSVEQTEAPMSVGMVVAPAADSFVTRNEKVEKPVATKSKARTYISPALKQVDNASSQPSNNTHRNNVRLVERESDTQEIGRDDTRLIKTTQIKTNDKKEVVLGDVATSTKVAVNQSSLDNMAHSKANGPEVLVATGAAVVSEASVTELSRMRSKTQAFLNAVKKKPNTHSPKVFNVLNASQYREMENEKTAYGKSIPTSRLCRHFSPGTATGGSAVDHAASQETFDVQSIRSAFESMSSPSKHSEGDSDEVSIKSLIEQYETTAEAKQENNVKKTCAIFEDKKTVSAKPFGDGSSNMKEVFHKFQSMPPQQQEVLWKFRQFHPRKRNFNNSSVLQTPKPICDHDQEKIGVKESGSPDKNIAGKRVHLSDTFGGAEHRSLTTSRDGQGDIQNEMLKFGGKRLVKGPIDPALVVNGGYGSIGRSQNQQSLSSENKEIKVNRSEKLHVSEQDDEILKQDGALEGVACHPYATKKHSIGGHEIISNNSLPPRRLSPSGKGTSASIGKETYDAIEPEMEAAFKSQKDRPHLKQTKSSGERDNYKITDKSNQKHQSESCIGSAFHRVVKPVPLKPSLTPITSSLRIRNQIRLLTEKRDEHNLQCSKEGNAIKTIERQPSEVPSAYKANDKHISVSRDSRLNGVKDSFHAKATHTGIQLRKIIQQDEKESRANKTENTLLESTHSDESLKRGEGPVSPSWNSKVLAGDNSTPSREEQEKNVPDSPGTDSDEFSDGVTLDASIAEVSNLTNPTALLSQNGDYNYIGSSDEDDESSSSKESEIENKPSETQSNQMTNSTALLSQNVDNSIGSSGDGDESSSRVSEVEKKPSETSSSQMSEAAAPLLANIMRRMPKSDEGSTDSFFAAGEQLSRQWSKAKEYSNEHTKMKKNAFFANDDELAEDIRGDSNMHNVWDLRRVHFEPTSSKELLDFHRHSLGQSKVNKPRYYGPHGSAAQDKLGNGNNLRGLPAEGDGRVARETIGNSNNRRISFSHTRLVNTVGSPSIISRKTETARQRKESNSNYAEVKSIHAMNESSTGYERTRTLAHQQQLWRRQKEYWQQQGREQERELEKRKERLATSRHQSKLATQPALSHTPFGRTHPYRADPSWNGPYGDSPSTERRGPDSYRHPAERYFVPSSEQNKIRNEGESSWHTKYRSQHSALLERLQSLKEARQSAERLLASSSKQNKVQNEEESSWQTKYRSQHSALLERLRTLKESRQRRNRLNLQRRANCLRTSEAVTDGENASNNSNSQSSSLQFGGAKFKDSLEVD